MSQQLRTGLVQQPVQIVAAHDLTLFVGPQDIHKSERTAKNSALAERRSLEDYVIFIVSADCTHNHASEQAQCCDYLKHGNAFLEWQCAIGNHDVGTRDSKARKNHLVVQIVD